MKQFDHVPISLKNICFIIFNYAQNNEVGTNSNKYHIIISVQKQLNSTFILSINIRSNIKSTILYFKFYTKIFSPTIHFSLILKSCVTQRIYSFKSKST